jgi:membrane-associated phospholipid phosphatase
MRSPKQCTQLELSRKRILLERAILTTGVMIFFVAGYFGIGASRHLTRGNALTTILDERIPFVAGSVWMYLWVFPCALTPLFVVRCARLFRRTAIAYALVIAISLVCFITFPVTSLGLRVAQAKLDVTVFSQWAISLLYSIDPPYNLFPCLHVSLAAVAAFSVWKASKPYGAALVLSVIFIGASVCTVKQHYLLDVVGGIALALLADALILRPYKPLNGATPVYS